MDKHRLAISTVSLGWHEDHTLSKKLDAAAKNGYQGVELVWDDLVKEAKARASSPEACATALRAQADALKLSFVSLAPFENYEGSPMPLAQRLRSALEWVNIARILGAGIIQVPASFDPVSLAVSEDVVVHELQLLADCGLPRPGTDEATVMVAYEPMSWSVRSSTWQHALYIKRRVARSNFRLCLDTYHILTKLWGDCTTEDGRIPYGDTALRASLHETLREMQASDIGFVQLSDAEKMNPPVSLAHLSEVGKHYAWYWSGVGRIFPLEHEHGAYLPMTDIVKTWLVDMGWHGWVSMEIFHTSMAEQDRGPAYWAERGVRSWERLKAEINESDARSGRNSSKL